MHFSHCSSYVDMCASSQRDGNESERAAAVVVAVAVFRRLPRVAAMSSSLLCKPRCIHLL